MISKTRFTQLDYYFYRDRLGRRKDFLWSCVVAAVTLIAARSFGFSRVSSLAACYLITGIALVVKVAVYFPPSKRTQAQNSFSPRLLMSMGAVGALALVAITLTTPPERKDHRGILASKGVSSVSSSKATAPDPNKTMQRPTITEINAALAQSRFQGRLITPNQLAEFTDVLLEDTSRPDAKVETWETASKLLSYRFSVFKDMLPPGYLPDVARPCIPQSGSAVRNLSTYTEFELTYVNCTLDINDIEGFNKTAERMHMAEESKGTPIVLYFVLLGVELKYDTSKPAVMASRITCLDCIIDIKQVTRIPSPDNQKILRDLLASNAGNNSSNKDYFQGSAGVPPV